MTDPNCHYNDGEHCRKGLTGTPCEVEGCVARIKRKARLDRPGKEVVVEFRSDDSHKPTDNAKVIN